MYYKAYCGGFFTHILGMKAVRPSQGPGPIFYYICKQ